MPIDADLDAFMERVLQRPLPSNAMLRVRILARELAEGVIEGLWDTYIHTYETQPDDEEITTLCPYSKLAQGYLGRRWNNDYPNFLILMTNGYLDRGGHYFRVTERAFQLLDEVGSSTVFISYRRKDSSAFAMYVLTRLKMAGVNAYLDMAILAGDDWKERVKAEIEKHDYFILLLGKETLTSPIVCQEIVWAVQSGAAIIPIWHNEFEYKSGELNVLPEIDEILSRKNAIRVLEESGLGYNNAIVELLNRFGITP